MTNFKFLLVETHDDGAIARIVLNRPAARNAQHRGLLTELGRAFEEVEQDDRVKVVILAGAGLSFSAGHDMGTKEALEEKAEGPLQHDTMRMNGGTRQSAEKRFLQEWHYFFANTLRWRNLRKITLAEVHGQVYSAGLMLMWCCDLIAAAEGTIFCDPVGTRLGMCGMEYFAHPWEFGPRKTKELMLLGDCIDAEEAYRLGMVSKIYPADQLTNDTLKLARRIATVPTMAALMVKESVNQSVDNMGFYNALQASFTLHQLNHAHWAELHSDGEMKGLPAALPEDGAAPWKDAPPLQMARKSS